MKNYFIKFFVAMGTILIATICSIHAIAEEVSVEKAFEMVAAEIPEKDVNVYLCKNYEDKELYWQFFVDADPMANWGHKCYIAKVLKNQTNISDGLVSLQEHNFFPDIELEEYKVNIGATSTNGIITDCVEIKALPEGYNFNAGRPGKNYAIIISGGVNKRINYSRYWNDCSLIYRILTKRYRIEKDNIYVAISDGTNQDLDINLTTSSLYPHFASSSLDLDFDGEDDTRFAATNKEIAMIFEELTERLTADDHLFIYVIDHGKRGLNIKTNQTESCICLWNEEELYASDLRDMLLPFRNKGVAISAVFGQCYSGGFVKPLSNIGCVVAAACGEEEFSYGCSNGQYDEFVLAWSTAMCGMDVFGNKVSSDFDGNNIVSMEEAFWYALANDKASEKPKYSSDPMRVGKYLAFNYIPPLIDMKLRDSDSDNLILSNNIIRCSWDSPDIWLRNSDDGIEVHQPVNLLNSDKAYINVRVFNVGRTLNEGNYRLDVKWALAGFEAQKRYFDEDIDVNNYPRGGNIGSIEIPVVEPFNSEVVCIEWSIPDELKFAFQNEDVKIDDFLFYAEIVQTDLPDAPSSETTDVYAEVMKNHRAAMKNVVFVDDSELTSQLLMGNPGNATVYYAINLLSDGNSVSDFLNEYNFSIQMPQSFYDKWRGAGGTTSCKTSFVKKGYMNFMFNSGSDYISGIPVKGGRFRTSPDFFNQKAQCCSSICGYCLKNRI
ncbi:MAG: C13 family peptidase [Muribaculaceae bacterium]|nr:C13 family peptidase [Muribaculaceae bacterium]